MNNVTKNYHFARFFPQNFFAFLLAAFVFVAVMTANYIASAATATHKVTDTTGTVTRAELTNVDLEIYAKYNADIQAISKALVPLQSPAILAVDAKPRRILAKAAPGETIKISIVPESNYNGYQSTTMGRYPFAIANNSFSPVKDDKQNLYAMNGGRPDKNNTYRLNIEPITFIPKNADMIYFCWLNTYYDYSAKTPIPQKSVLKTEYYIFTSDEAFKRAYKIWTGKTPGDSMNSPNAAKPRENRNPEPTEQTNNAKQEKPASRPQEDDDDDWGAVGKAAVGLGAAGAIGFGISKLGGGSGAAEDDTTFVYKDPATGAETLYEKDPETGEWVNPITKGVLNMDDLDRFNRQRMSDREWMDRQMDNLRDRNTDLDRAWRNQDRKAMEKMRKDFADIDYQGAKDRLAVKTGTYGMSDAERDDFLKGRQKRLENKQDLAHQNANNWDRVVKVTEGVEKAADIGVDVLSKVTAPAGGKAIGDAYAMTKNVAKSTSEAIAEGKSVLGGIAKGLADGAIDVAQNNSGGVYQTIANVGGEAFKGGMDAAWKGESITQGAFAGSLKGAMKLGIERVGDKITKGIEDSARNGWNYAKDHADTIRQNYSPHISQKSAEALHKMNLEKYTNQLKKGSHQELANTIGNAVAKNTLPDAAFGD